MSSGTLLERWLDGLADIGEAVGGDEPVPDLLDRVARTACTLLDYDFCAVFLPDESRRALTIVGAHGLSGDYIAQVNANRPILLDVRGGDEAPTSVAFRGGEVVTLEDIDLTPGIGPWGGVAHEQGYRALISVPLRRAGVVVGALNGYRKHAHRFDQAEISLVTTLATQVAIALGTAQLRASEQNTIRELRRAEEVHALLTATALRGEGVAGVAAALAELLGHPVAIEDVYGEALASAGWGDRDRPIVTDHQIGKGEVIASGSAITTGVVLDGQVVARIHVDVERNTLSGIDIRAVEHASVVTALELLRARTAAEVEQRLRGSLVADLLTSGAADVADLLDRARRLGWDLSGGQVLLAIRCVDERRVDGPATERLLATVDRSVAGVTPRPLVSVYHGDLVLVWNRGRAETSNLADRLVQALTANGALEYAVAAMASTPSAAGLPATFRAIRGALDLGAQAGASTVIDLHDLAIDHLLLQLDDPVRLRDFAESVLGPAMRNDHDHATELIHTVRALLEHDLDRAATATTLHLHANTVRQRIRRLESLTGLQLSRPRDLLTLTAALSVSRIAGLG